MCWDCELLFIKYGCELDEGRLKDGLSRPGIICFCGWLTGTGSGFHTTARMGVGSSFKLDDIEADDEVDVDEAVDVDEGGLRNPLE